MKSLDGTGTDRTILSGIHAYYEPEELIGKTLLAIVNLPPRPMMGIDSCGMLISALHTEEGGEKLHLLMLDNHIPAGVQVLKQIKQTDSEARVIICAGLGQGNSVMEAMKNGAADFIVKPFLSGRLLTMVERCLS